MLPLVARIVGRTTSIVGRTTSIVGRASLVALRWSHHFHRWSRIVGRTTSLEENGRIPTVGINLRWGCAQSEAFCLGESLCEHLFQRFAHLVDLLIAHDQRR